MAGLTDEQIGIIVTEVQRKKELQGLSCDFVATAVRDFLRKNSVLEKKLLLKFHVKSAVFEYVVKNVRAELRRSAGLFQVSGDLNEIKELVDNYFAEKIAVKQEKILVSLLESHASTQERLVIYSELYTKLFAITGKPGVVLDLGCGLNPLSLPLMKLKSVSYFAYDIHADQVDLLNAFFDLMQKRMSAFNGKARILDLLDVKVVGGLPKADMALLFKVADVLDKNKGHTKSEAVFRAVPARFVVVSFATKTMSGKRMTAPRRIWMEWMCDRLGWKYTVVEFENEIFYVVEK
ncbi:MAG: hypothetical protein A2912_01290 [Candidatus Buchananbacteria bacterium RIFCSPLOWO2_01_FULL_40_23b]|uniref:16S rRNA (guanine(1405)-N(7))-methyltransferase n=1 Tax=Candidatus Buchananbacteria bacterium RIFCSPLOWO2_01_FULL_40_23b TaxID=1797544 RepID=A0A1G1YWF3_9BACT|nr:MAG: hypothetical protein A2912_01290 [Candidatus Buchananbacteria bacterium RIFCSPLOWO2_01_FULL_40_23b]